MDDRELLERITANPEIFGGKPIVRGHRMAVEHVLQVLATGISLDEFFRHYPWLEREDVQACLLYAAKVVGRERVDIAVSTK
jgi:uncharacterized protein (DUF433 family)